MKKSAQTKDKDGKDVKFEDCLQRLESLVQEMESGNLPLEDILKKYEEGNRLVKLCAGKLNEAEQRIEILMKEKNGSLALKSFEESNDEGENSKEDLDEEPSSAQDKDDQEDLF